MSLIRLMANRTNRLVLTKRCIESIQIGSLRQKDFHSPPSSPGQPIKKQVNNPRKPIDTDGLKKVREAQRLVAQQLDRRRLGQRLTLNSYLTVCVDVGQINRAFNLLVEHSNPAQRSPLVEVAHYNIVLKGWAKLGSVSQIVETRMHMIRNNVEPNAETFANILLGYSKSQNPHAIGFKIKKLVQEMRSRNIDPKLLFQSTYLNATERRGIKSLLKTVDHGYDDTFCDEPIKYDCNLLAKIHKIQPRPHDIAGGADSNKLASMADHQRFVERQSSITIKSIARQTNSPLVAEKFAGLWNKYYELWRKGLSEALDNSLDALQKECTTSEKVNLYPYLCSVDKNILIHLLLDEIENNATFSSFSMSTSTLHLQFGDKIMKRYLRTKSLTDGSYSEVQQIYRQYLVEYCSNPELVGKMTSREYIQRKAIETKNYAIYKDKYSPVEQWPHHIVGAVGKFLYGILLREVKFDPDTVRSPNKEIKQSNLVHAFYTAYLQINHTHKIKEEFRAHQDFETLHRKSCAARLRFDYSYLPTSSPPLPWLSHRFGGYLTNKSDLVRMSTPFAEKMFHLMERVRNQKLYPSLDSLNSIGLCPWTVNKEILDIVITLFRSGGDADLTVPLEESKMLDSAPKLAEGASKADRILYNREKKRYDQKKREMYSLWRDCLYRLSIANHFRDRVFWFPHNLDFRGRTYPIPPHFNHLGSDLARSLLLFAKGRPLGEKGLDWLKIHLINLVGCKKKAPLSERLDYANSILHIEILDSADNPWDGRRWWTKNDSPWQVLACCKEIAKAIRSRDHRQYISHFPVHQDGSCNGLQHYAALGRDTGGAMAVNLIPCETPQDVYSRVVDIVESMRKRDCEADVKIAKMLEGHIQRKVIKQTVMTTVYGVTHYGARLQIARQLQARGFPDKELWQAALYLSSKTLESIGQMFNKSRQIQDWLNDCAFIISSKCKQPVSWETPLGFPVTQPYFLKRQTSSNRLTSSLGAGLPSYNDPSSKLNAPKQKTAFPPNYIHSLDSSHMMLTSLFCQRRGITFVSVHDCYWTHPDTVDSMNNICREQFVALHSQPLLHLLAEQFLRKFASNLRIEDESLSSNRQTTLQQVKHNQVQKSSYGHTQSQSGQAADDYDTLVDLDLKMLLAEKADRDDSDSEHLLTDDLQGASQSLIKMYEKERQLSKVKIRSTFKDVPKAGDLDLRAVLKSTYFFS